MFHMSKHIICSHYMCKKYECKQEMHLMTHSAKQWEVKTETSKRWISLKCDNAVLYNSRTYCLLQLFDLGQLFFVCIFAHGNNKGNVKYVRKTSLQIFFLFWRKAFKQKALRKKKETKQRMSFKTMSRKRKVNLFCVHVITFHTQLWCRW